MDVKYGHKKELTFIGYHTEIHPEEGYKKCPEFWDNEFARKFARLWKDMTPVNALEAAILNNGIGMYAICTESDNGFLYWIAGIYKGGDVPDGLELYTFPESDWAMFTANGPLPYSLQALNSQVWQEWFPNEGKKLQADGTATLEVYSAGNARSKEYECGIWVPIKTK